MARPSFWNGKQCFVDGCEEPAKSRGVCKTHYAKFNRHGSVAKHRRPTFAEVRRQAIADAVITLVQAKILPSTASPQVVADALDLQPADLHAALARRRGKHREDLPRANVDRRTFPPGHKRCSKCKKVKPLHDFHSDCNSVDGHYHMCASCKITYQRQWRRRRRSA